MDCVDPAGVEQDALCERGLAAVDVRADAYVAQVLQRSVVRGAVVRPLVRLRLRGKASEPRACCWPRGWCCTCAERQPAVAAECGCGHAQRCSHAAGGIACGAAEQLPRDGAEQLPRLPPEDLHGGARLSMLLT